MPCCHDFGVIPAFDPHSPEYEEYTPEKYGCVPVDDDDMLPVMEKLRDLDTFYHRGSRPAKGFAWCGITLIPPASLGAFLAAVEEEKSPAFAPLAEKIREAMAEGKYMIHYGL